MKPVRIWLWIVAALIFLMVMVGGATRLTESGLSITEWKLVTGVVPPLNQESWQQEFEKYKKIPQYSQLNPTMTLEQFKTIYYWEWGHRLLGRIIGIVFALPLLAFWLTGRVRGTLTWKLLGLLALGGLQGAVGWWMVVSGLAGRVEVAPERLAIHLLLASITLAFIVSIAVGLRGRPAEDVPRDVRGEAWWLVVAVMIQIGLGALVAGSRAGLTYNTWPLMDGHLIPGLDKMLSMQPLWRNFFENITTVQFQHRMFAYLLILLALGHAAKALRFDNIAPAVRRAFVLVAVMLVQAGLGIATLLWVVPSGKLPIHLALAHQAVAMGLLIMAVAHWRRMVPPARAPEG